MQRIKKNNTMTAKEILAALSKGILFDYHNVDVPEFTYGDLRIDLIKLDVRHRWVRGYEIKVDKSDFNKDQKWTSYSRFLSSLCIVCPEGLIDKEEVESPFGLIWIESRITISGSKVLLPKIIKRAKNFQKRNSLSWLWTYVKVIETEFPRIAGELNTLKYGRR